MNLWVDTARNADKFHRESFWDGEQGNSPGDGKFDILRSPANDREFIELGSSRADMGLMRQDEHVKMKVFLDKLHAYKHAHPTFREATRIALRSGNTPPNETTWHFAAALTGLSHLDIYPTRNIPTAPETSGPNDEAWSNEVGPYLFWSRGSGPLGYGGPTGAIMWVGVQSYYGYWFHTANMPERLGEAGLTLSWTWHGWGQRWFYHPLGTGDVMGEVTKISVNNRGSFSNPDGLYPYQTNDGSLYGGDTTGFLFMQHIGDVAFRPFMIVPPKSLKVSPAPNGASYPGRPVAKKIFLGTMFIALVLWMMNSRS